jgi:hypothetical protein
MAEGGIRLKNIASVAANAITAENIISFKEEHIMNITPQFVPNTFQGVDVLQRAKWRELTIVMDSENNVFDVNFSVVAANTVIGTAIVATFDVADGAGTQETWTYVTSKSWVTRKDFGRIEDGARRNTTEYKILMYGTKVIA